ncbi:disease resistance protein TAO1 isoform X2 [Punica granatum]|nr:disease resistance protein TAO1 isoform X2 [Punica granatum]XP_031372270.1 disease resistance protein TAO1 isoform X2 [Punica granatum]XP_031372271.1 disease resistance protein TAO1 isoform X2 [Punica granatum]XP_031372272.1 disease resistance protein TAO1 isoform X2 [Punica granatum]XP_031372273.1 disease resistance protein TAO1 isoform X2 [Punica granatum]XP_031372274.1 disease resistance protein TAO1 isoform X2 [Punica granatum]
MVQQWEDALREAGKIKGWELKDKGYGEFARFFAREVSMKLKVKHKCVTDYLVQRDDQVEALMKLLDIESSDVRFVGVHGMGGIGNTTLAKVVFNKLCDRFANCSFLADVQESSRQHGIERLQKQLLNNLGLGSVEIMDVDDGIMRIREMLVQKRVLIVLDDVGHWKQIQNLTGDASWFASGSRIIVTTRDQRVLEIKQQRVYTLEVEEMKPEEALRLFSMHAFEKYPPPNDYLRLLQKAVASSGGLPLALEVTGSLLRDKRRKDWVDTIKRLERVPHPDVQDKLMISYEALDPGTKQIFLDIACFFINYDRKYPTYMWEACDFDPKMGLKVLVHMSLVKIIEEKGWDGIKKKLWMHDQLRDLGRKIVADERFKDVMKCSSRLWMPEDALKVLREEEDKENIEMLRIHYDDSYGYTFNPKELSSLRKLRYLECWSANFSGHPKHFLPKLMWLSWRSHPRDFMGTDLYLRNIVILDLSWSTISETWGGWNQIWMGSRLKVLDLTCCYRLTKTPDFSKYLSLERLILRRCENLLEIDPSIGKLRGLKHLDLSVCTSLRSLPEELCCLDSLQVVCLNSNWPMTSQMRDPQESHTFGIPELIDIDIAKLPQTIGTLVKLKVLKLNSCIRLKKLPDSLGNLRSLTELDVSYTGITKLPDTIWNLKKLRVIKIRMKKIKELPSFIGMLKRLKILVLNGCERLEKLPDSLGNLRSLVELDISETRITELPDTVWNLKKLRVIRMVGIRNIKELPSSIGMLNSLEVLNADLCHLLAEIPSTIEGLTRLRVLNLLYTAICVLPPKLPTSLTELYVSSPSLQRVPKFSKLKNLVRLVLINYGRRYNESGQVRPSKLRGIGKLHRLVDLTLDMNITSFPKQISSLSQLQKLTLRGSHLQSCPPLPSNLSTLILTRLEERIKLPQLSNLKSHLSELEIHKCSMEDDIVGKLGIRELDSLSYISFECCNFRHLDGFHLPESLRRLFVEGCSYLETVSGLSHLKNLQSLEVSMLDLIVEIPELGELESLQSLKIGFCDRLERLENLSKLKKLRHIEIFQCEKFKGIDNISELEFLEVLRVFSCDCEDMVNFKPFSRRNKDLD